jgi:tetratricopeptide (TPR) repeat protein
VLRPAWKSRLAAAAAVVAAGLLAGCDERPWVTGKADPKEEANFRQAEAYHRLGQYTKAVEYFQRALDVNPRNADAHLGLGLIHSDPTKIPEYGFAYYHLNRYVEMARATNDPIVVPLIQASGLKLAERYANAIGKIQTQGELEQLKRDRAELLTTVSNLTERLNLANLRLGLPLVTNRFVAPRVYPAATAPVLPTNAPAPQRRLAMTNQFQSQQASTSSGPAKPAAAKSYKVQPRETLAAIARKNGVTVAQLQAANPGVDARKLKVGQELRIP